MYSYVDLLFSPDGMGPLEVADRLRSLAGLSFVVGPHDLLFEWGSVEEFRERITRIRLALAGTGVTYRVESLEEVPEFAETLAWPPAILRRPADHPAYAEPEGK